MLKRFAHAWLQRSFPICRNGFFHARCSYSQFGEDAFAYSLLGYKPRGTYLDVGCYHPIQYSNTYGLYLRGWCGVCIDANPVWKPLWEKYRRRDKFLNVAVAKTRGEMRLRCHPTRPGESFVYDINAKMQQQDDAVISACPLKDIVAENANVYKAGIDLLSIDCEGQDRAVLESLDLTAYRPTIIIVEVLSDDEGRALRYMLRDHQYTQVGQLRYSLVFRRAQPESLSVDVL